MSTVHLRFAALAAVIWLAFPAISRAEGPLKPFKDSLFSQQTVLSERDNGDFRQIDYQEMRDINGRDQIPEKRVKQPYVSLGVRKYQANETLALPTGPLDVFRAGKAEGAAFTVIFIHGRGGDRRLGANDYSFGGNFNRLKNLAVDNGGVYYAPSVRRFDTSGAAAISDLIVHASAVSPGKPVILACASMGSFICWGVARDASAVANLAGMAVLGGATDPDFRKSAFHKARKPIFFTHGSADKVYAAAEQIALYDRLHAAKYPVRFTLFETGSHGTPVRMTDWRAVLNWLLTVRH